MTRHLGSEEIAMGCNMVYHMGTGRHSPMSHDDYVDNVLIMWGRNRSPQEFAWIVRILSIKENI